MQPYPAYNSNPSEPIAAEVMNWFRLVDKDKNGKINAEELQSVLVNGHGKHFSEACCHLMIRMFDIDRNGTIDESEFVKLYAYINQWLNVFKMYDRDQSGNIDEQELSQALQQMGFRFSPSFVNFIVSQSDVEHKTNIDVDQFILLSVRLQQFTETFRQRDIEQKGKIEIAFEDFFRIAMELCI